MWDSTSYFQFPPDWLINTELIDIHIHPHSAFGFIDFFRNYHHNRVHSKIKSIFKFQFICPLYKWFPPLPSTPTKKHKTERHFYISLHSLSNLMALDLILCQNQKDLKQNSAVLSPFSFFLRSQLTQ